MPEHAPFQRTTWPAAGKKAAPEHMPYDLRLGSASTVITMSQDDQYRVSHGYYVPYYGEQPSDAGSRQRNISDEMRRFISASEPGIHVERRYADIMKDYRTYQDMPDPKDKRVLGALVVGTMFNRAARIELALLTGQALPIFRLQDTVPHEGELTVDDTARLKKELHSFASILLKDDTTNDKTSLLRCVHRHNGREDNDGVIAEIIRETFKVFVQDISMVSRDTTLKMGQAMEAIDETAAIVREIQTSLSRLPALRPFLTKTLRSHFDAFVESARARTGIEQTDYYYSDIHTEYTKHRDALFEDIRASRNAARHYAGACKRELLVGMKLYNDAAKIIEDISQLQYPLNASAYTHSDISSRPKSTVERFAGEVDEFFRGPQKQGFSR